MRIAVLALTLLLMRPAPARAEWQLRPFLGVTFGGRTTYFGVEQAAGDPNLVIGFNSVLLGELIGIDADVGYAPGFFQSGGQHLVTRSSATTLTGNIVVALPRRLTEFTLRPYFVGGAGVVQARINDPSKVLSVSSTLPAVDLGGGVTGFLSDRIGVSWDVRHFRSFGGKARNLSFGREQLSFWRANMALVFRY
jgi:hypothetical protein